MDFFATDFEWGCWEMCRTVIPLRVIGATVALNWGWRIKAGFDYIELIDGSYRKLTGQEKKDLSLIPKDSKLFTDSVILEILAS